ncbi:Mut7-C RNAse domain-containing protein [Halanaerobium saccharolyticum]|uniref:Mut7-C RNAse domain-containing protein n=1 Tax=Halanaerobium saccharolyticum TaxID=43595 RepID=UPI0010642B6B|nr:Mut7-C RNAse domain-containing protein [Halanaerobium saccharolyticum]
MIIIKKIKFRIYSYLNDFIKIESQKNLKLIDERYYIHHYRGRQTIKDRIESIGVPHPEVALILNNSRAVDFSYLVQSGDFFSIYPHLYTFKLPEEVKLLNEYSEKPKFILDVHLGRLARYLRRFGFDTAYRNDYQDREIVDQAVSEKRIILSRDRGLLMRKRVKWAKFIWSDDPKKQLKEVFDRFQLAQYYQGQESRCVNCNTKLVDIDKEKIIERLEPKTKKYFDDFKYCPRCDKIYWCGSHYEKTEKMLTKLKQQKSNTQ